MIRQATTTDFAELSDIYHDASLIAHPFIDPQFIAEDTRRVRDEYLPLNESYVYEVNGEIQGFISLSKGHINGLFLKVEHQRKGIGTALINHAKERHSMLELFCFIDNKQAQQFYKAQGFTITHEKANDQLPFEEYVMKWVAS